MSRTPRALARWLGAATASIAIAVAVAPATPAAAAKVQNGVRAILSAETIPVGVNESTGGLPAQILVGRSGNGPFPKRVTVKIDATKTAGTLIAKVSGGDCTVTGLVTTCDIATPPPSDGWVASGLQVNLKVASGAQVDDQGTLRLTTSGAGMATQSDDFLVTVAGHSPVIMSDSFVAARAKPGEVRTFRPLFHNFGDKTATNVILEIIDTRKPSFTEVTQRFSNCRYLPYEASERRGGSVGYCDVKLDLAPGETAQVSARTPIPVKVSSDAPGPSNAYLAYLVAPGAPIPSKSVQGDGPTLVVEKTSATVSRKAYQSAGRLTIPTTPNPADVAAVGATVKGDIGAVVPVKVGFKNNGPAYAATDGLVELNTASTTPASVVTFPGGVTVVSVPGPTTDDNGMYCMPVVNGKPDWKKVGKAQGLVYLCSANFGLNVGQSRLGTFDVKITSATSATGSVVASGGLSDANRSNNTATIALNPPAGGEGGGLANTGANTGAIVRTATILLVAGFGLCFLAIRRRRA